jgi:small redox-active disulfide protein 2
MNSKINSLQVLGSGCPTCKKLFELTQEAVSQLNLGFEPEYITDIQKIIELGVMSSPVLTINGKVALVGQLPSLDKLKEVISGCTKEDSANQSTNGCSCGGNC